jgi:hypothetical protein
VPQSNHRVPVSKGAGTGSFTAGIEEIRSSWGWFLGIGLLLMLFEFACGSETELVTHANAKRIREDFFGSVRSGLIGTPTFFNNGVRHNGAHDY